MRLAARRALCEWPRIRNGALELIKDSRPARSPRFYAARKSLNITEQRPLVSEDTGVNSNRGYFEG